MENEPERNEKEFRRDTEVIVTQGNELLKALYPYHLIAENEMELYTEKDSSSILSNFKYFRIKSCFVEKVENEFDYLYQKMQKLFSAIHPLGLTITYGIVTINGMANIVFGINDAENIELIKRVISGLLLGIELEEIEPKFKQNINYKGIFSAIPSYKIEDEKQKFDISPLMRGLNGEDYTLLFIATPVSNERVFQKIRNLMQIKDECFAVSKRNIARQEGITRTESESKGESRNSSHTTGGYAGGFFLVAGGGASYSYNKSKGKNWSTGISETISKNDTISGDVQNSFALELMEYAEEGIERFRLGQTSGMWKTVITYSSDSILARNLIQSSLSGEIAKPNSKLLSAKSFSSDNATETLLIPKGILEGDDGENPLITYLNSSELSMLCTLPTDSTPNFELINQKQYSLRLPDSNGETIEIGKTEN